VSAGGRDEARLAEAREGIEHFAAACEADLAGRDWLCGAFSVVDIATSLMLHAAATLGAPVREEHAKLRAWRERELARPAIAKEVAELAAYVQGPFATNAA
jgi:glutathione S-transferase